MIDKEVTDLFREAQMIDYAVLRPEMTPEEILTAAKAGIALDCRTICVNPVYISMLEPLVKDTNTSICPTADFPFGTSSTASRVAQIKYTAQSKYVKEIDIVINYGRIRGNMDEGVTEDLKACVYEAHKNKKKLKVIIETDALTEDEIRRACRCVIESGADFVKSSTGFLTGHELKGACVENIAVMLEEAKGKCLVKASGSIRTREQFLRLIEMGVDRLGINYRSVPAVLGLQGKETK